MSCIETNIHRCTKAGLLKTVLSTGLISLGSDLAFYAIVSGSGVFFQLAYIAPIVAVRSEISRVVFRKPPNVNKFQVLIRGRQILPERKHFDLGRWATLINYISVGWALLVVAMYL